MLLRGLWLCDLLVNMEFVVIHGRATFIFHPLLSVVKIFIFSRFPQNKKARENQSKKSKFVMWNIFNASANNFMLHHSQSRVTSKGFFENELQKNFVKNVSRKVFQFFN